MKNAVMLFKRPDKYFSSDYLKEISDVIAIGGVKISSLDVMPADDLSGFKMRFSYLRDTADNMVIIASETDFDLKSTIAELLNTELLENENALEFTEKCGYDKEFARIPVNATLIPNRLGAFQGFMCEDEEFTLMVLPEKTEEFSNMYENYVAPYFKSKYGGDYEEFEFKYFGDAALITKAVKDAVCVCVNKPSIEVRENFGDVAVKIEFRKESEKTVSEVKRKIVYSGGDKIYADCNITLGERLFDLLKLRNLKISVAESFTGGRVVSEIIKNSGASAYVQEGIVSYSNQSKIERLSVSDSALKEVGAVSAKVAYQMAAGLLMKGDCDVALSTTGIAGPFSDNTNKPVGLGFIGVGMKDGVHVYKYNFCGDRERITETAKNTALFLAINKLKKA